ncbi:4-hydroxy-2-oxoheptanedioate aldolase [Microlunatus sagamiharensis]|uniref:4-hydroxy-2-oxoheptanedioate aldolase n=1 Tax=Microlunatus sagamiharensis TaxID=546874 RepID=A0A1H2NDE2_9ACTN|nr:aldolase/citrate lyase family protein [Microlunatus sagamiharensis]SDV03308.1 4-hydroxy-2-oxoheptanedioate aldolase [Microlunatus sagamiharensis]
MSTAAEFARRLRSGDPVLGYWVVTDNPVGTERLARTGYDYVALDLQHGLIGYSGMLGGLTAVDAAGQAVGLVRVEANLPTPIGKALDAGAAGVIVPLVNTAQDAAAAVAAAKYPPTGIRSYGPMRSALRVGPDPVDANESVVVLAMIETPQGLANVEEIAATPGLDGLYIGPSDLALAVGAARPGDPAKAAELEAAIGRVLAAAQASGVVPGIHTPSGDVARQRLEAGFRLVTVASDLTHLEAVARGHLDAARERR